MMINKIAFVAVLYIHSQKESSVHEFKIKDKFGICKQNKLLFAITTTCKYSCKSHRCSA